MARTSASRRTSSPLGPGGKRLTRKGASTVLQVATGDYILSEKEQERACDRFIQSLGGQMVRFSQARATQQTEGISDRRYRVFGLAFWFEVKAEDGKLSRAQYEFLRDEQRAGALCGCGTAAELAIASTPLPRTPEAVGARLWRLVDQWAAKGFRGERKTTITKGERRHEG